MWDYPIVGYLNYPLCQFLISRNYNETVGYKTEINSTNLQAHFKHN